MFSVWPNIRDDEIRELEGVIRHIFRFDEAANKLNVAKAYYALGPVRRQSRGWIDAETDMERVWKQLPHKGETGG